MNPRAPLEILYEDGPVLAVNKPAGLLTQGIARRFPSLELHVKSYLKEKYAKPGNVYLGIPHRLDRPVSGVVVFARNSKAARRLAEQFQQRQVRKIYWGIVERTPEPREGILADWLRKLADQSRAEIVPAETENARACELRYRTIAMGKECALVEIEPLTGRMHQIRVQLASRGFHLLGDTAYGAHRRLLQSSPPDPRSEPIALHARSLTFLHPIRYEPVTVTAPVPATWSEIDPLLSERLKGPQKK